MAGDRLQEDLSVLLLMLLLLQVSWLWLLQVLEGAAAGDGEVLSLASMLAMEKEEPLEDCSELGLGALEELVERLSLLLLLLLLQWAATIGLFFPESTCEVTMGAETWACRANAGVKVR